MDLADASQRRLRFNLLAHLAFHEPTGVHALGLHHAGVDGVHTDVARPQLLGEGPGDFSLALTSLGGKNPESVKERAPGTRISSKGHEADRVAGKKIMEKRMSVHRGIRLRSCVMLISIAFVLLSVRASAQRAPPKAIHSARYASPSGEYVLFVDPSDIYGRGPAKYRMTRSGEELWQAEKPYTLYDAAVSKDGTAAGYAYSHGLEGFAKDKQPRGSGTFIIAILDLKGRERTKEETPREQSRFLHAVPNPLARGMFLDADNDRLIVRVADPDLNRSREVWWAYKLSTGEKLPRLERDYGPLGFGQSQSIIDARSVAGTPLTLIHWYRYEYQKGGSALGGRFALLDASDAIVWSLELPGDYNIPDDKDREDRLIRRIRSKGAILDTGRSAQFDLWFVHEAQRVTFSVTKEGGSWQVREVNRAPYTDTNGTQPALVPERKIAYLGHVELEGASTAKVPVRDVLAFDIDSRGRLGLTRSEDAKQSAFVLVEPSGNVLREVALDVAKKEKEDRGPGVTWLDGERWLVYVSPSGIEARSPAWFFDAAKGEITAIEGFECPSIEAVDGTGDGGFIALGHHRFRNTSENELLAFDAGGKKLWSVRKDPKDANIPFFANAVAVTTSGRIALLQTVRKRIDLYDLTGKYLQSLDLKAIWKRDPGYPHAIAADEEGGFIIEDFEGKSPAVWMDKHGAVRLELPPVKFAGGLAADLRSFRISAKGEIWATDRSAIVRVTKEGVVDRVLGARPTVDQLEAVAAVTTDARGNLYVADERSGAVHVFTPQGKRIRVCAPAPGDFIERLRRAQLTVTCDGDVYLVGSIQLDSKYVHFSPQGERIGLKGLGLDRVREEWIAQPTTPNIWVVGYQRVFLVDGQGKVQKTIERRADGKWLERIGPAAVATDGSLAVVAFTSEKDSSETWSLNLYSPIGEAVRTLPQHNMPVPLQLAYEGSQIALLTASGAFLLGLSGESLEQLQISEAEIDPAAASIFLSVRDGTELWVVPWKTKRLHRFSLK